MNVNLWIFHHYATLPGLNGHIRPYNFARHLKLRGVDTTIFAASFQHFSGTDLIADRSKALINSDFGVPFVFVKTPAYGAGVFGRVKNMASLSISIRKQGYRTAARKMRLTTAAPNCATVLAVWREVMKQLFLMVSDGSVKLLETPAPTVKENDVIVETEYSVVSAGTERGLVSFGGKGLLQKIRERPDQAKKVLEKMAVDGVLSTLDAAFTRLSEPMPMGYSGVGTVTACGRGVTDVSVGDRVAMAAAISTGESSIRSTDARANPFCSKTAADCPAPPLT